MEITPRPVFGIVRAVAVVALALLFLPLGAAAAPLKITIASDSTAASFSPADYGKRTGWGQVFSNYFNTNVVIDDLASSGRSSKSFYDEGKWKDCLATHADYYLIQFGHNDGKIKDPARYTDPQTTFRSYLSNYVNQARARGGVPVLITPPTRRNFESEHVLKPDDLQEYARAMRELATNMDVPLLDVLPVSVRFYESAGKSGAKIYQANTATNTFENDKTHFSNSALNNSAVSSSNASFNPPTRAWRRLRRPLI